MKPISVPRTPKSAYNPKRRVSDLLKAHISNLEAVTGLRTGVTPKRKPKNEAQASAYIVELTRQLHPDQFVVAAPPVPPAALTVAAPPARRRRTARKKKAVAQSATTRGPRHKTGGKKTTKTTKKRKTSRRSSRD